MIASLLLERRIDDLVNIALPLIQQEKESYSDSFTQYIEALFEEFDFEKAQKLSKEIGKEASQDLLLAPLAEELEK